jgi:hypothetical protein
MNEPHLTEAISGGFVLVDYDKRFLGHVYNALFGSPFFGFGCDTG